MMKKFKKWRDKLTISQVKKIMWIVGILTEVIITLNVIVYEEIIRKGLAKDVPIWLFWIILSAFIIIEMEIIIYWILKEMN